MKVIETDGITYIKPIPGATSEWYYGLGFEQGDLYEAEQVFHDSFFLRDGNKLFFNRWHEEGEGENYKYWEETIVKDLSGNVIEKLPGDVMLMPNGELWHLKKGKDEADGPK